MAVGPGFNSPETQAALAAQAGTGAPVQPTVETPEVTPKETPPEAAAPATETGAGVTATDNLDMSDPAPTPVTPDSLKAAGFTPESIGEVLHKHQGKLPEDVITSLKEKFSPEVVDKHVKELESAYAAEAAAQAKTRDSLTQMNTYIYETLANGDAAKGQDNFKKLSEWCGANMDEAQLEAINTLLTSGKKDVVRQGLTQAVAAWRKGTETRMMTGDAVTTPPAESFEPMTRDEYVKTVATKKYQEDAEYRDKIDARRRKTLEKGAVFMTPEFSHLRPPV